MQNIVYCITDRASVVPQEISARALLGVIDTENFTRYLVWSPCKILLLFSLPSGIMHVQNLWGHWRTIFFSDCR